MPNPYYNASGVPSTSSYGYSAAMRGEFANITAGFALLPPTLTANKAVVINGSGTGMGVSTGSLTLNGDLTVATGKAITVSNSMTITATDGASIGFGAGLAITAAKSLSVANTLNLSGTDGANVNFGAGGTVLYSGGSFVNSIAGTANEITASAATGAVTLSLPTALTFTGKTVTGGTFSSPTLSGTPTAPTQSAGDNSTKVATTAYVDTLLSSGTFTPIDNSGAALTLASASGFYRKHGNMVTVWGHFTYPATGNGSVMTIGGLPFTSANLVTNINGFVGVGNFTGAQSAGVGGPYFHLVSKNSTNIIIRDVTGTQLTNTNMSTWTVNFCLTYPT